MEKEELEKIIMETQKLKTETIIDLPKNDVAKMDKEVQRLAKLFGNEMKRRNQR
jgi:hypothetical protein